jgi:hypothetical protein
VNMRLVATLGAAILLVGCQSERGSNTDFTNEAEVLAPPTDQAKREYPEPGFTSLSVDQHRGQTEATGGDKADGNDPSTEPQ